MNETTGPTSEDAHFKTNLELHDVLNSQKSTTTTSTLTDNVINSKDNNTSNPRKPESKKKGLTLLKPSKLKRISFKSFIKWLKIQFFSIRFWTMMIIFSGIVIVTISIILLNYFINTAGISEISSQKDKYYKLNIEGFVVSYLKQAETLTEVIREDMKHDALGYDYNFDITNIEYVTRSMIPLLLRTMRRIKNDYNLHVGYADLLGSHWTVFREWTNGYVAPNYYKLGTCNSNISEWTTGYQPMYIWLIDETNYPLTLNRTELMSPNLAYDPRLRLWWKDCNASEYGELRWTQSINPANSLIFTVSSKIHTIHDEYIGIAGIRLSMEGISDYLTENYPDPTKVMVFLMNIGTNNFMGTNVGNSYVQYFDENGKKKLYYPSTTPHPILNPAGVVVKSLTKDYTDFPNSPFASGGGVARIINGVRYLIFANTFNSTNLDILSVSVIPYSNVYGNIELGSIISLSVSVFILGIVLVIAFTFGFIVLKPLYDIGHNLRKVQNMDLEDVTFGKNSIFSEVKVIQNSFFFAVKKLKLYKSFLPRAVLRKEGYLSSEASRSTTSSQKSGKSYNSDLSKNSMIIDSHLKVGIDLVHTAIVLLKFYAIDDVLRLSSKRYLSFLASIFDFVNKMADRFGGILYDSGLDKIICSFNTPSKASRFSFEVEKFVNLLKSKFDVLNRVHFNVFIHFGLSYSGVCGSRKLRKNVIWGDTMKVLEWLGNEERVFCKGKIDCDFKRKSIFVTDSMHKVMENTYIRIPVNIAVINRKTHALLQIEEKIELKNDEWMYELKQKEDIQRNQTLIELLEEIRFWKMGSKKCDALVKTIGESIDLSQKTCFYCLKNAFDVMKKEKLEYEQLPKLKKERSFWVVNEN